MGAFVSSPGTTMEAGSVDGIHRGGLGSMGVVIVAWLTASGENICTLDACSHA